MASLRLRGMSKARSDASYLTVSPQHPGPAQFHGAQLPAPTRTPVLTVNRVWPSSRFNVTIVWAQGNTAYAIAESNSVYKTTDGGLSWTRKSGASLAYTLGYRGCFLKTTANTLLAIENSGAAPAVRRSTDDGATWSAATFTMRTGTLPLGSQSWCQDAATGYIYLVEYQTADTLADIRIYRSTDDGATFAQFGTAFPGPTGGTAGTRIRHFHATQYDSVSGRVYFTAGDVEASAGIYRVNAGGTDWEAVYLNSQSSAGNGNPGAGLNQARCIGLALMPNFIAWMTDESFGNLVRMDRAQIGQASPVATFAGFTAGSSGWNTCRASADGKVWLITGDSDQYQASSNNPTPLDYASHVYAVTDDGATITEVGALGAMAGTSFTALMPVGQAELHSADLWLTTGINADGTSGKPFPFSLRANLAYSQGNSIVPIPPRKPVPTPSSVSSGVVTVPASGTVIFHEATVPPILTRFFAFDGAKYHQAGTGTCVLEIIRMDTSAVVGSIGGGAFSSSWRLSGRESDEFWLNPGTIPAGTVLRFQLRETGGAATETVNASVTFGFGLNAT